MSQVGKIIKGNFGNNALTPLDITLPEFCQNPYPFYEQLRDRDPVHRTRMPNGVGLWLVTRYQDVNEGLRDTRLGRETRNVAGADADDSPMIYSASIRALMTMLEQWLLFRDPPTHTRLRGLINRAFSPRIIEQFRPRISEIAASLITSAQQQGRLDIIADYAFPLPVIMIAELLGVPASDRDLFRRWSAAIMGALDLTQSNQSYLNANQATLEACDYLSKLVAVRRQNPTDDLLSALIAAEEAGQRLSESELYATCILLLFAGHETTVHLIGNGLLALLQHPDQLALLRQDESLINSAVEEILRYDGPVHITIRLTQQPLEIAERLIYPGDQVAFVLAAANRDPRQFANPDQFDIKRQDNRHLAFGAGIHYCVGAALARLEARIAIMSLLQALPNLSLPQTELRWRNTIAIRGLESFPVQF